MPESMADALQEAVEALHQFQNDETVLSAMQATVDLLVHAFRSGGKAMSCGNGGSMTDAMHFAEEFSGRFRRDRPPLPAIALSDPAHLTCVANDYGFDHVFSRQVEALGKPDDVLILLSTSGNSPNMLLAAEAAKEKGVKVVGCLGKGGGKLAPLCDVVLMARGEGSDRIQELHMLALHAIIEAVEKELGY